MNIIELIKNNHVFEDTTDGMESFSDEIFSEELKEDNVDKVLTPSSPTSKLLEAIARLKPKDDTFSLICLISSLH